MKKGITITWDGKNTKNIKEALKTLIEGENAYGRVKDFAKDLLLLVNYDGFILAELGQSVFISSTGRFSLRKNKKKDKKR